METPELEQVPEDDAVVDEPVERSRARSYLMITLIILGIVVVGVSLLVVLWMLFSATLALLDAAT